MVAIQNSPAGVTFAIKVHPRAKKNAITGEVGDALKVALTAPPMDGKANEACIEFFAKLLKVPRSSVTIASGLTSRNKVIRVAGLSVEELENAWCCEHATGARFPRGGGAKAPADQVAAYRNLGCNGGGDTCLALAQLVRKVSLGVWIDAGGRR